MIGFFFVG